MNLFEVILILAINYGKPTPTIKPEPTVISAPVEQKNTDPRVVVLENYLTSKKSPLAQSAHTFIEVADQYQLEWTLLPAIAGVESGFERAGNTNDFNAWGYMCKNRPCSFASFDEGIRTVARTIGTSRAYAKYRDTGEISDLAIPYNYVDPEDWSRKVQYFQEEIK